MSPVQQQQPQASEQDAERSMLAGEGWAGCSALGPMTSQPQLRKQLLNNMQFFLLYSTQLQFSLVCKPFNLFCLCKKNIDEVFLQCAASRGIQQGSPHCMPCCWGTFLAGNSPCCRAVLLCVTLLVCFKDKLPTKQLFLYLGRLMHLCPMRWEGLEK